MPEPAKMKHIPNAKRNPVRQVVFRGRNDTQMHVVTYDGIVVNAYQEERKMNELDRLRREVRYLRHYGNKDCTAMADEAMGKGELEEAAVPRPLPARVVPRLYDPVRQCCHAGCTKPAVDMHGVGTVTHGFCLEHRTCNRCGHWVFDCPCPQGPMERPAVRALMGMLLDLVVAGKA